MIAIEHDRTLERTETDAWASDRKRWREFPTAKDFRVPLEWLLRNAVERSQFVNIDHPVLGGTPRIKDTRIPIYSILEAIEHHGDLNGALRAFPQLTINQVKDALIFAALVLECSVDGD